MSVASKIFPKETQNTALGKSRYLHENINASPFSSMTEWYYVSRVLGNPDTDDQTHSTQVSYSSSRRPAVPSFPRSRV